VEHGEAGLQDLQRRVTEAVGGDPGAAVIVTRFLTEVRERTARYLDDGTVFLLTGDIPAMWLRDSAAQVLPFLRLREVLPLAQSFVIGVLRRQLAYIAVDPYANAFNVRPDGAGHSTDVTAASPWVWERKYEVDSLCYPLWLAHLAWRAYGRDDFLDDAFWTAAEAVLTTWETELDHEAASAYRFQRFDAPASDTLVRDGLGPKTAVTGLTWSGFRPSDDAARFGYNVPGNMFAVVALGQLAEILTHKPGSALPDDRRAELLARADALRECLQTGIAEHAVVDDAVTGPRWAYEVDGLGGVLETDDANVPSLLALPLLGYCAADDPTYLATRAFVLSERNPAYVAGRAASGVGSPHTPPGHVWPIAIAVAALTSGDRAEQRAAIATLLATDAGTARVHESFHADDPRIWTREWFSWAEAMFTELVLDYCGYAPVGDIPIGTVPASYVTVGSASVGTVSAGGAALGDASPRGPRAGAPTSHLPSEGVSDGR